MTLERFWRTMLVNCEALPREILPAASEAAGKRILGTFVVVDLAGFGCVCGRRPLQSRECLTLLVEYHISGI